MKLTFDIKSPSKIFKKISLLLMISSSLTMFPQLGGKLKDGLKFYFDSQDSTRFIKMNLVSQMWARYTENNPLTTVNNYAQAYTGDVSIRRERILVSGQLTDRVSFFTQFGENSMNYTTARKTGAFFHDVTAD